MNLSPRLETLVSMLDILGPVADIGTDHAQLPIYLAQEKECSKIIATEYKEAPYRTAVNQVKSENVKSKIECRKGFGLQVLNRGEVDEIIIAGMGGFTIRDIISDQIATAREASKLILQPMSAWKELRSWLLDNQFKITEEQVVKEKDKFYQLLAVEQGEMEIEDSFLLEVGPKLVEQQDPMVIEYLNHLEKKWGKIISEIKLHKAETDKLNRLEKNLAELQEVKECLLS